MKLLRNKKKHKRKKFIMFLDIDGVLVTLRSHFAVKQRGIMRFFDPVGIMLLNRLHEEHDVEFVVSSTWSSVHDIHVTDMLKCAGFRGEFHKDWTTPKKLSSSRGLEINLWLEDHPKIKNYIILDDGSDFTEEQKKYHVQTDIDDGILSKHWIQIEKIIEGF